MDRPRLSSSELDRSPIVANSAMNRERGLMGPNSYTRELGFNPLEFLKVRLARTATQPGDAEGSPPVIRWLDVCCGSGRALLEAIERLRLAGLEGRVLLQGIDLMPMFLSVPAEKPGVRLVAASLAEWEPEGSAPGDREGASGPGYDLITCVHGLHYLGDKLDLLRRAFSWLAPDGLFVGHLDLENIRREDGSSAAREVRQMFRSAGVTYDARRHLLRCEGPRRMEQPHRFLGADDRAGPNYTGQEAVNSYYDFRSGRALPCET